MGNWNNLAKILDDDRDQKLIKESLTKELLEYVAENDKKEIKRVLFMGVSPNVSYQGRNSLIVCMETDNLTLGIYFLTIGASASYQEDLNLENAFWYALRNQKYDFLDMFILNNCNVTRSVGEDVETALIFATKLGDARMVESLLTHGKIRKKVNEIDREGRTALHYNISKEEMTNDDVSIGKMLLAAGASQEIRDLDGHTPEQLAKSNSAKAVLLQNKIQEKMDDIPVVSFDDDNDNSNTPDSFTPSFKI